MFVHLHVHSHYSVLDGMSKVPDLVQKCVREGMTSCALTDHGVMYGIYELYQASQSANKGTNAAIAAAEARAADAGLTEGERAAAREEAEGLRGKLFKPIYGLEAYCARRGMEQRDSSVKAIDVDTGRESSIDLGGWHLILLAKDAVGYHNLCRLTSASWTEGFYGKPRIDKELLAKYHEGLICSSACLGGEIAQLIMQRRHEEAEAAARWFQNLFGEDYYLEVQLHPCGPNNPAYDVFQKQQLVNPFIFELAAKLGIKVIATNDSHFLDQADGDIHDELLCIATGSLVSDKRRMHYTKQEWLKTPAEMQRLFAEHPEALANTAEVAEKCEWIALDTAPQMPKFPIPESFGTEAALRGRLTEEELKAEFSTDPDGQPLEPADADKKIKRLGGTERLWRIKLEADYLRHLTLQGATARYGEPLPDNVQQAIDFELQVMKTMGFPGYFLIVWDFIRAAREELDVWVGPGRGSAAGSVVAYCLHITDIDPLKYDLLFERFLNPDRISLPDIDTDFADDGRGKVIDWVTQKYGAARVAHIVTYGSMATKSSIADVCRVEDVALDMSRQMSGLVPVKFDDQYADAEGKLPPVTLKNCFKFIPQLRAILDGPDRKLAGVLKSASELEGTIRQVGIHACGVIIAPDDIEQFAPLATIDDKEAGERTRVTQYDGHCVESVGLIKMDFLGLCNLRQMREACRLIKRRTGKDIDIFHIPLDDQAVFRLYSEGRTVGVFQFESAGMQKYLKELQPSCLEDLIAMNALFRPGPLEYIPQFIRRKHGQEPIVYDLPGMDKYLASTYGVTVYQEQVMLLSRLLAGFTRGESDVLRKAMGKKQHKVLAQLKPKFIAGGQANGHPAERLEKIWHDWEAFASYAFNKSHATCYAWVSYQTAWLKTHYPSEYLAALMSGAANIADVAKFMDEARALGLPLKAPDVNHSDVDFAVEEDGSIVFGLGKVKGVGSPCVAAIIAEREAHGPYADVYDFFERVKPEAMNTKSIEALAQAGAFDGLPINQGTRKKKEERRDKNTPEGGTRPDLANSPDASGLVRREHFFALSADGSKGSEVLIRYAKAYQSDRGREQPSLFGNSLAAAIARPPLPKLLKTWSDLDRANLEKDVVGIYITSHPLDPYLFETTYLATTPCTALTDDNLPQMEGQRFCVAGIVKSVKAGTTRTSGKPYAVPSIEDRHGSFELPLFGRDHTQWAPQLLPEAYVCVEGQVLRSDWGDRKLKRQITRVTPLRDVLGQRHVRSVQIAVDARQFGPDKQRLLTAQLLPDIEAKADTAGHYAEPHFLFVDTRTNMQVRLAAPGHVVRLGAELCNTLAQLNGAVELSL